MTNAILNLGANFGLNERYEILKILGEGGMGVVYKAYDNILKEYVAIKTLLPKYSSDDSIRNRFLNEAKLCLALTHSNIIRVRDVSIYDDIYYMVMEYIEGVELKEIMKTLDNENLNEIYLLIRPILSALDFAHTVTIHRDIKPANIMIKENKAYLMDFGISKALENSDLDNKTQIGGMGTKKYASPEQIFNANDVDKTTDIYSMGILIYELFTKKVPKNTALEKAEKPSIYNNNITEPINTIILQMIESKNNMRPKSFQKIIDRFDNIFAQKPKSKNILNENIKVENTNNLTSIDNMVLISEGKFLRGSGIESKVTLEKPRKSIFLDEFYINKFCVTNLQYNVFIRNTKYKKPKNFDDYLKKTPNYPVVFVSYFDALEYCKYNNCTLPSEAQWEKTAKNSKSFIYPWGNEFDELKVNIGQNTNSLCAVDDYENGKTTNDVYNLAGNIWEWCLDDFDENFYKNNISSNPVCINKNDLKVVRGGSFDFVPTAARCSFRFNAHINECTENIGFRVVKNAD